MPAYIGTDRHDYTDEPREGWTKRNGSNSFWDHTSGCHVFHDYNDHPSKSYSASPGWWKSTTPWTSRRFGTLAEAQECCERSWT